MEYDELIRGFAEKFGVEGLAPKDGVCALDIDGVVVSFIADAVSGALVLVARVGQPPPEGDGGFGDFLLKSNYIANVLDGLAFCQDPDTGSYALQRAYPFVALDAAALAAHVEALVNRAESWKEILSDFSSIRKIAEARAAREPVIDSLALGFLQV